MPSPLSPLIELATAAAVGWIARSAPSFRYRQIGFVHKQREGVIALVLWVVLLLLAAGAAAGVLPAVLSGVSGLPVPLEKEFTAAMLSLLVTGGLLSARRQPLKSLGWGRATLRNGTLLGISLVFMVFFLGGRFMDVIQALSRNLPGVLVVAALCLAEETIFRGYIQLRLDWWLGRRWGLLATAGLAVVWRLPFLLALPGELAFRFGLGLAQAAVLGWLAQCSGHTLAPALYRILSTWSAITLGGWLL
jgi:membrane protease YdiL (CAAX protease family)